MVVPSVYLFVRLPFFFWGSPSDPRTTYQSIEEAGWVSKFSDGSIDHSHPAPLAPPYYRDNGNPRISISILSLPCLLSRLLSLAR